MAAETNGAPPASAAEVFRKERRESFDELFLGNCIGEVKEWRGDDECRILNDDGPAIGKCWAFRVYWIRGAEFQMLAASMSSPVSPVDSVDSSPAGSSSSAVVHDVARPRLDSVDLLRGMIMVLMALDHVRDFFPVTNFDPLDLSRTTPA